MSNPEDRRATASGVDALVLGCGYVGCELTRRLTDRGVTVAGVRRSRDGLDAVERAGGIGIRGDVTSPDSLAGLPEANWIVFAASAGRGGVAAARETYLRGIERTIAAFSDRQRPPDRLLYTSSTGVYGDHEGAWVDETTPIDPGSERAAVLRDAEKRVLAAESHGIDGTVIRFGGLYGPDRYRLDRYLEGPVTEGILNSIHRDDAAGVLEFLILEDLGRNEVVLAVDDEPTDRWAFADWLSAQCGRPTPTKLTKSQRLEHEELSAGARRRILADKRCSNEYLRELGYEFEYPTVRDGYRPAIRQYRSN